VNLFTEGHLAGVQRTVDAICRGSSRDGWAVITKYLTSAFQLLLEMQPDIPAAVSQDTTGNVRVCEFISLLALAVTWKRTPAALSAAGVCMSHSVEPQHATKSAMSKHKA